MDWTQDLVALAQVVMIDVALAGDNAVVVGLAVAGLPSRQQRRAIVLAANGETAEAKEAFAKLNPGGMLPEERKLAADLAEQLKAAAR